MRIKPVIIKPADPRDPTYEITRGERKPLTPAQLEAFRPSADDTPLTKAKRFAYAAGLPAATVPFFQQILERLDTAERRVAALEAGAREKRPLFPARSEFRG